MAEPTTPAGLSDAADADSTAVPAVVEVRRDSVSREIRLELADWRTRTGGVYDLTPRQQEALMLPGQLPGWGDFLPDFVIVLATGEPAAVPGADGAPVESVTWTDLRLHVGGVQRQAVTSLERRRGGSAAIASAEWHSLDAILGLLPHKPAAPGWLVALIRERTPWGPLLDTTRR